MPAAWLRIALVVVATLAMGCQPEIGDECQTDLDCSALGDRLCDTSQPSGYCTVFNCEPDACTDEAVCVAFNNELDPACGTADDGRFGRFGRTFCMRVCGKTSDCRSGYECIRPSERAASVIDKETDEDNPQDTKICIALGVQTVLPTQPPNACFPNTNNEPLTPYEPPGTGGAGGMGGMGGMSAGGMGGMSAGGMGGMSAGGMGGMGTGGMGGMGTGGLGTGGMGTGGLGTGGLGTGGLGTGGMGTGGLGTGGLGTGGAGGS